MNRKRPQPWIDEGYVKEDLFSRRVFATRRILYPSAEPAPLSKDHNKANEQDTLQNPHTGLPTARAFLIRLDHELKRAKRYKRPLSIGILSIDQLNTFSASYGLQIKGLIIPACAQLVRKSIRNVDMVAHCAKDQLAVIWPETYASAAMVSAERIRKRVSISRVTEAGMTVSITVSIGIASFPTHARKMNDILTKAFESADAARANGGNSVIVD